MALVATLVVVLGVGALLGPGDDSPGSVSVTADATASTGGDRTVHAASVGSPTEVRELLSETTSTLVAATASTTSSSTSTSTTEAPTTTEATTTTEAPTTTAATTTTAHRHPTTTTTAAPTTTSPPTTAAPTTTTTAPPATTTTTAPQATTSDTSADDGDYAYDDPRSTQVWYDLADCESGGNWSIDTGNGYYGGLQFALSTWESVGGTGYPHEHPAETQIEMGRRLQARDGWGAWPHCSEKLGLR